MGNKKEFAPGTIVRIIECRFQKTEVRNTEALVLFQDEADIIHCLLPKEREVIGLMPGVDVFVTESTLF